MTWIQAFAGLSFPRERREIQLLPCLLLPGYWPGDNRGLNTDATTRIVKKETPAEVQSNPSCHGKSFSLAV
jgi:hypothetical protein